jgi:putative hydrolase of the HAD superfamily
MSEKKVLNLVFDLGGVVFSWQPEQLIQTIFPDPGARQRVKTDILQHPDWAELDRGVLEREIAIQRAVSRTGFATKDVTAFVYQMPQLLTPIPGTIALLQHIKQSTAHHVFALSNMHPASIRHIEQTYPIWDVFDGLVISCYVQKVKPELAIYQHLLTQYKLAPAETIFIDDSPANLDAARQVGLRTIRFENPEQCECVLTELGCL